MKSRFSTPKYIVLFAALLSGLFVVIGFGISFQQDRRQAVMVGETVARHFFYASELKDDMGAIDLSKRLENFDQILAYQLKVNGKVVVDGGNRDFIPASMKAGILFRLPSVWIFKKDVQNPGGENEFTFVHRISPGPIFWGLFGLITGLLSGALFRFFPQTSGPDGDPHFSGPNIKSVDPVAYPPRPATESLPKWDKPFLLLDQHCIIQQVSAEAAGLLKKSPDDLLRGHLLDLAPGPGLMTAIEKGMEGKLLHPFAFDSSLSVFLKLDQKGILLFLERTEGSENRQKH